MLGSYIFIFFGIIIIVKAIILYIKNFRTLNWKKTKGIIIKNNLVKKKSNLHKIDSFECEIEYKYIIIGSKEIIGNMILPFVTTTDYTRSLEFNKKLKIGTVLKVFYNPKNNKQSCLIKGQHHTSKILFTMGLICLILGLLLYLGTNKEKAQIEILNKIEIIE